MPLSFAVALGILSQSSKGLVQYPAPRTLRLPDFRVPPGAGEGGGKPTEIKQKLTAAEIHSLIYRGKVTEKGAGGGIRAVRPDWLSRVSAGRDFLVESGDTLSGNERVNRTSFRVDLEGTLIFIHFNIFGQETENGTVEIYRGISTTTGNANLVYARGLRLSYVYHRSSLFGTSHSSLRDYRDAPTNDLIVAAYGFKDETAVTIPVPTMMRKDQLLKSLESALTDQFREMESHDKDHLLELMSVSYSLQDAKKMESIFRNNS
jgi:hypothetical protein